MREEGTFSRGEEEEKNKRKKKQKKNIRRVRESYGVGNFVDHLFGVLHSPFSVCTFFLFYFQFHN